MSQSVSNQSLLLLLASLVGWSVGTGLCSEVAYLEDTGRCPAPIGGSGACRFNMTHSHDTTKPSTVKISLGSESFAQVCLHTGW